MGPIFTGDPEGMEGVLIELLKSAPIAGAVLATVFLYMKAQDKRDKAFEERNERWFDAMSKQVERTNDCIDRNSEALGRVETVLQEFRK